MAHSPSFLQSHPVQSGPSDSSPAFSVVPPGVFRSVVIARTPMIAAPLNSITDGPISLAPVVGRFVYLYYSLGRDYSHTSCGWMRTAGQS